MAKKKSYRLDDLQLGIMQVLWERGPVSAADVHNALGITRPAYPTVAATLKKMEKRGLVKHKSEGRRFLYRSAVAPKVVTHGMTTELLDKVFAGSLADLMTDLLKSRKVSAEELLRLERLIAERKRHVG